MATTYYRPFTSQPIQDGDFPPENAVATILPQYMMTTQPYDTGKQTPKAAEELDESTMGLLDHQMKELDNYRNAVHKMGQDILVLRKQISNLEDTNSQLRRDIAHYNDATKLMLDSAELDGLTKPEICSRYVAIKQKLASQTAEFKSYKERVQELQNELIKKNDKEKELVAQQSQRTKDASLSDKLQDRIQKVKKLEDACRKQEKVIEKMERMLERAMKERGKKGGKDTDFQGGANDVLLAENRRLRQEIEDLKEVAVGMSRPQDDMEKLDLYQNLDKSERRITTLEKQLADSARQWGKEKADMLIKLNESEHGFNRQSHLVLHDYPPLSFPDTKSYDYPESEHRRFSKSNRYGSPKLEPLRYN